MNTPTVQSEPASVSTARVGRQRRRPAGGCAGPRLSPAELAFLIGVPLLWAVLLLFHPGGEGTQLSYLELQDKVTAWMVVHSG